MELVKRVTLQRLTNALFVQFLHNVLKIFFDLDPAKL